MLMVTPVTGAPVLSATLPRSTDTRFKSIVFGTTPVCIGFGPEYRNAVDANMLLAPVGSSGGATVLGSGGSPLPETRMLKDCVALPPRPSVTRTVTANVPDEPGVHVTSPPLLMLMPVGETESA